MSDKNFAEQFDDETVLMVFRRHPIVMRKGLIFSMLGLLAGTLPGLITLEFSWFYGGLAAGFFLAVLLFAPAFIAWYFSIFIVTDQRFIQITQKGLFHRSFSDLGLQHIQTINYDISGLEQTILGFGTIVMQTYMGDLVIRNVYHPAKTHKNLNMILREQGITPAEYPPEMSEKDITDEA